MSNTNGSAPKNFLILFTASNIKSTTLDTPETIASNKGKNITFNFSPISASLFITSSILRAVVVVESPKPCILEVRKFKNSAYSCDNLPGDNCTIAIFIPFVSINQPEKAEELVLNKEINADSDPFIASVNNFCVSVKLVPIFLE